MRAVKEEAVVVTARKTLKEGGGKYVALSFAFFLLCLICSALCLVSVAVGVLAFCLFALPFYFGFIAIADVYAEKSVTPSHRLTLKQYGAYFRPPFFGCFRVFVNLAKSIGSFFIGLALCLLVYGLVANAVGPLFQSDYARVADAYIAGDVDGAYAILDASVPLLRYMSVSLCVGVGAAFCTFLWWLVRYSLRPSLILVMGEQPGGFATFYYNRYFALAKKEYMPLVFKRTYGMFFAIPLGYALGAGVSFLFTVDYAIACSVGLATMSLVFAAYLPWFGVLTKSFFLLRKVYFYKNQVAVTKELLAMAAKDPRYDEDYLEGLRQALKTSEDALHSYEEDHGQE